MPITLLVTYIVWLTFGRDTADKRLKTVVNVVQNTHTYAKETGDNQFYEQTYHDYY